MSQAAPAPGTQLTAIKLREDGSEAARWPVEVIEGQPGWVVVKTAWQGGHLDLGYAVWENGDIFYEYYAVGEPYNAFAVLSPEGMFKGWYCNVSFPCLIEGDTLSWQDLYLDVVFLPDGQVLVLDEDELADSGLETRQPETYRMILSARDRLTAMIDERAYPFSDFDVTGTSS